MNPSTTAAAAVLRAGARAAVGRMCGITARSARRPVVAAVAAGGRSVGGGVRVRAFTACVARREAGEKKAAAPADEAPQKSKIWSFEDVAALASSPSPSTLLIDVREPGELASTGRIPGALNVPVVSSPDAFFLDAEAFEERFGFEKPVGYAEVVFYCKAGVRSRAAAGLAREGGWGGVVGEFPGSWLEWVAKGGRVERG